MLEISHDNTMFLLINVKTDQQVWLHDTHGRAILVPASKALMPPFIDETFTVEIREANCWFEFKVSDWNDNDQAFIDAWWMQFPTFANK